MLTSVIFLLAVEADWAQGWTYFNAHEKLSLREIGNIFTRNATEMTGFAIRKHTVFPHYKHASALQITYCLAEECINIFRYMYSWFSWHRIKWCFHGSVHKQNPQLKPKIFHFTSIFMPAHARISHHPLEKLVKWVHNQKILFIFFLHKDWAVCWFHIDITFFFKSLLYRHQTIIKTFKYIKTHWLGLLSRLSNWQPSINQWQLQENRLLNSELLHSQNLEHIKYSNKLLNSNHLSSTLSPKDIKVSTVQMISTVFGWRRNVEERIMQPRLKRFRLERQWNHNNTSVSPSPSWGSWIELISHNISKQTLLAWLTHTTLPNWLPGVLRL